MAQITRAIEIDGPVDAVHEEWLRFEEIPRCSALAVTAGVRWRAEVLTFEPLGGRTRVKLRIEYEPSEGDAALPRKIDALLRSFAAFRAQDAGVASAHAP